MVTNLRKVFLLAVVSFTCFAANAQKKKKKDDDKSKVVAGAPAVMPPKPAPKRATSY